MSAALGRGADRPEAHEVYCVSKASQPAVSKKPKKSKKPEGVGGFVEFLDFFDIVMADRVTAGVIHQSGKHRLIGTIIFR